MLAFTVLWKKAYHVAEELGDGSRIACLFKGMLTKFESMLAFLRMRLEEESILSNVPVAYLSHD